MNGPAIKTVSLSSRGAIRSPLEYAAPLPSSASLAARPKVWLGAQSAFGLSLPEAKPTRTQLYAPRGVWIDHQRLIVCDSGNHRVLIWNQVPTCDGQPADVVLGQQDFQSEGPAQGSAEYERGMHLPTAALVHENRLLIADAWHHRILVWEQIPTRCNTRPDYCIGQERLDLVQPNRGSTPTGRSFFWPYGMAMVAGRFYVTDTGNRRVLAWDGLPDCNRSADWILGQSNDGEAQENRGGPVSANSFRWPHAVTGNEKGVWIADAGNHRVLGWAPHPTIDCEANWVLGQPDMWTAQENPYRAQGERALRFPYGICSVNDRLIVADTSNNRILFWKLPLTKQCFEGAIDVVGQIDFDQCGENRWQCVSRESLCWPYGVSVCSTQLAIADSGNNRVMIWDCASILSDPCEVSFEAETTCV